MRSIQLSHGRNRTPRYDNRDDNSLNSKVDHGLNRILSFSRTPPCLIVREASREHREPRPRAMLTVSSGSSAVSWTPVLLSSRSPGFPTADISTAVSVGSPHHPASPLEEITRNTRLPPHRTLSSFLFLAPASSIRSCHTSISFLISLSREEHIAPRLSGDHTRQWLFAFSPTAHIDVVPNVSPRERVSPDPPLPTC